MGPGYEPSEETAGYPVYEPIGYIDQAGNQRNSTMIYGVIWDVDGRNSESPGDGINTL